MAEQAAAVPEGPEAAAVPPDRRAVIEAAIEEYNRERPAIHANVRRRSTLGAGVAALFFAGLTWAVAASVRDWEMMLYPIVIGVIVTGLVWYWLNAPARRFQQDLRDRILPVAFGLLGEARYAKGAEATTIVDNLKATDLITFSSGTVDDCVAGLDEGEPVELAEVTLTRGSGKSRSTVFRGLVFHFGRKEAFPGRLLVSPRPNAVARFFRDLFPGSLAILETGRGEDATHDFRTDNPAAARAMAGGNLDRALEWLARAWPDGAPLMAFWRQDCFLMLPSKRDYFELPGIGEPLDYARHVEPMVWDLVRLLAIARLVRRI